jgi:hypothetical protein
VGSRDCQFSRICRGAGHLDEVAASEPRASRRIDYAALAVVCAEAVNQRDVWRNALKKWNMRESMVIKERQEQARKEERSTMQTRYGRSCTKHSASAT